jgi:uncharacterized protein YutE (UPF0331/DUF86 family)
MSPGHLSERIVTARIAWVREMVARIRALPLASLEGFAGDARNVASAESYLRRALEALLDLGRHLLAKGFGIATTEYKEIAARLQEVGVFDAAQAALLTRLAGYRNRLVHFYHEVGERELHEICSSQLDDIERLSAGFAAWVEAHPDRIDRSI